MIDFRSCLYGLSDVIINRPTPLRLFDQIYMKLPDMLLQAELTARWCDGKSVLFIGDGDAIALNNDALIKTRPDQGSGRVCHGARLRRTDRQFRESSRAATG